MKYTHAIPIEYNLPPGPLWLLKHTEEDIERMTKAAPYTKSAQYDQEPAPKGGSIFKSSWWEYYDLLPYISHKIITADTAQKTESHNDYSVLQCWGKARTGIYLIDQLRGKWEAPELLTRSRQFYLKHNETEPFVSTFYIEDKSSGSSLIQTLKHGLGMMYNRLFIPVVDIQRNQNKVQRAHGVVDFIASGYVFIPMNAEWTSDYVLEFTKFTALMNHKHDDQIDPTMDAIEKLLVRDLSSVEDQEIPIASGVGAVQDEELF